MKKSILIMIVVIACVAMAVPVFAAGVDITANTQIGSVTFQPSTNVSLNTESNNGTDSPPNVYAVVAWHSGAVNQDAGWEYGAYSTDSVILRNSFSGQKTPARCTGSLGTDLGTACPPMGGVAWAK